MRREAENEETGECRLGDLQKIVAESERGDSSSRHELVLNKRNLYTSDLCQVLPFTPSLCSNLKTLDLSRNRLESIPTELFSLSALEHLDLSRNHLAGIPPEIQQLQNLVSLILLSNKLRLRLLPLDEIAALPNLNELDVRYNPKLQKESIRATLSSRLPDRITLKTSGGNSTANGTKESACDRNPNELRSQLEPISTPQLRKRLHRTFGVEIKDDDEKAYDREYIMKALLDAYAQQCPMRTVRQERGVPVSQDILQGLLREMEAIAWPGTTRERPKIAAEYYMILQKPVVEDALNRGDSSTIDTNNSMNAKRQAAKLEKYRAIWDKAVDAIEKTDKEFADRFTALAVTKNFQGSPHIDTLNVGPFYAISMGEFTGGGKLCVECSAACIAEVDTKGRFAKIDGRFPHWVSDYQGTRYSLIYYVTRGEVIPQTTAIFEPPFWEKDEPWVAPPSFVI
mmetsp:Transcript_23212/g.44206  ORF Transcript_23212/g.44206 Transcript_23212/m.44206 type:complete len:455 (-) Transcript_23212:105-1469(-)|eukprot:scaffold1564_cov174-Amphora_coffeaeformis.AAC.25